MGGISGIEPITEGRTAQIPETRIDATQGMIVEQANNSSGSSGSSPFKKEIFEMEGSFDLDKVSSGEGDKGKASSFFGIESASSVHVEESKGAGYLIPKNIETGNDGDVKDSKSWLFDVVHKDEVLS